VLALIGPESTFIVEEQPANASPPARSNAIFELQNFDTDFMIVS
jgi:hypothetical protein